jgi:hypothetical protein
MKDITSLECPVELVNRKLTLRIPPEWRHRQWVPQIEA